jgi:PAS domain S-box-containing protein
MGSHSFWRWNIKEGQFNIGPKFWECLLETFSDHFSSIGQVRGFFLETELDLVKDAIKKTILRSDNDQFSLTTSHQLKAQQTSFSLSWKGEVFGRQTATSDIESIIGEVSISIKSYLPSLQMPNHPEFYQQLMDNLPDSVFFKDLESRFLAINNACATKFGLDDPSEAIGKTDFDFFNLSHAQQAFEDEQKIIKTGEPIIHKTEKEIYSEEDKEPTWTSTSKLPLYNSDGLIIGTYGVSTDITKQKRAQEQNERLKSQLISVLDSAPNLIFVKDRKGEYVLVNQATADFHGLSKEEIIGKTDFELGVSEENAESFLKTDLYVIDQNENVFIPEDSVLDENGNKHWYQTIKVPFQLVHSDNNAVLSIVTDITTLKKKQLELNESLDLISHQNHRLKNFTHIVSHNLRNHAGSISLLIELMESEESPEQLEEYMDHLKIASDRLNGTMSDLNEIIDEQYKNRKVVREVNLNSFVANTIQILSREINSHNASFDLDVPNKLQFTYNPAYLESILLNLFSNAIKYRHPDRDPVITVSAYKKAGHIYLEVHDNGRGIDLQKHGDNLFGMYQTFHNNEDAKGIGLYITQNQIESMGGVINVESTPGKGSSFYIRLN